VDRQYDLFEIFPDGSPLWRESVTGQESALHRLKELSSQTRNEVRALHIPTNTILATMNRPESADS
jgi:hypothetical protein